MILSPAIIRGRCRLRSDVVAGCARRHASCPAIVWSVRRERPRACGAEGGRASRRLPPSASLHPAGSDLSVRLLRALPCVLIPVSSIPSLILLTPGDFPCGNRGCHASHRACYAVPARPLRGCGFPSHCRNVNITLAVTFRSRRSHYRRWGCRR